MRKTASIVLSLVLALTLCFGVIGLAACSDTSNENYYTVTFVTNGGNDIEAITVKEGEKAAAPETPVREGYEFDGWFKDGDFTQNYYFSENVTEDITLYAKWKDKETPSATVDSIIYGGQTVALSERALYVDQSLTTDKLGNYSFNSLQACIEAAKSGTKGNETKIYLAPDVYWTDDYSDTEIRDPQNLIGLKIPQAYVFLIGMTGNREDVVIASDRGQNAGANGNYNTIGISTGFHAKDITFGNYCNVDLVYARDTSKNHAKRQEAITQAQVITKVPDIEVMDEWFFEDCSFVSRLNLFSRDDRPYRTLYTNCHFECTDDSIGTGYISLFADCDFDFYSNTPCGGASHYLQAFLGCEFTTQFASDNKTLTLCKNTKPFAFVDCSFSGDMEAMAWKPSGMSQDIRNIVYNNTLNGEPLIISPDYPDCSVIPSSETLLAFKVGETYNIYNLLNNTAVGEELDEWDPLGQKDELAVYASPWNIQFDYEDIQKDVIPELVGDGKTELTVTPLVHGFGETYNLVWSADSDMVTLAPESDGTVKITATNYEFVDKTVCITCTAGNGLAKVLHMIITSPELDAPQVLEGSTLSIAEGEVVLAYTLSENQVDAQLNPDRSVVEWYRSPNSDGSDGLIVATSTYVREGSVPYTNYKLTAADIGSYLTAVISPKYKFTEAGQTVSVVTERAIAESDVATQQLGGYSTDFSTLAYINATNDTEENNYEWTDELKSGFWYGGFYLPAEYREGGVYEDKKFYPADETPWTYSEGQSGALGTYGMQTTTQGARLVYVDDTARTDMSMTVELSPHKTAAQGFGSAKQFLDIYFKYDAKTMTGYGLRITRQAETDDDDYKEYLAKSCSFQLMSYENGVATPISEMVFSTAFLPGCTIVLDMTGNTLSCRVTTTTEQDSAYPDYMAHSVELSHTFEGEVNAYSGFGFQHTGTAGAGKSGNRTTIHSVSIDYKNGDD